MARVLVVGVAVVDFVFDVGELPRRPAKYRARDAQVVGGGCGANAAVAVARLGGEAALAARVGDDAIAGLILGDLLNEGVDVSLVHRSAGGRSAFSSVFVDDRGERQIVNFRGRGLIESPDWIAPSSPAAAVLADTRWSAGALRAMELARAWGVPGVIDGEAPVDAEVLACASHVAFSREGLLDFTSRPAGADLAEALHAARRRLPGWLCVTDGAAGLWHLGEDGLAHVPAFPVKTRDTLGAGDVWHGAFALALAEGQSEAQAVRFASAAAALKCTAFGGRRGAPGRAAVEGFLKENDR